MIPGRVTLGTVIPGRVTGGRMADGRLLGIVTDGRLIGAIVLPDPRIGRVVTGLLVVGGRTVVGRLGMTNRLGRDGKVDGRVTTGRRVVAAREVPKERFAVLFDVARRLLVLSARVKLGLQVIAATRLNVSKCLLTRIMDLLLLGSSKDRLLAKAPLQPCKRQGA